VSARRAGLPEARPSLLAAAELARAHGDVELLARIGVGHSRGFFSRAGQVDAELVAILRDALAEPVALPPPLHARAVAALAAELTWAADGDDRFALADTALDLARAAGDPAVVADVLRTRHLTVAAADTVAVQQRDVAELVALAEGLDDVALRFEASLHATGPAITAGDTGRVEDLLAAAGRIAETLRQPALQWMVGWSRASLLLWQGRITDAEKCAVEASELGAAAGRADEAAAFLGMQLLEIRRLQGRLSELEPILAAVPVEAPHSLVVARYAWDAGRRDLAELRLRHAVPDGARIELRRDLLERPRLDSLAFLAARTGSHALAAAVHDRLAPLADTFGRTVVAHPVGHHWLGLVGPADTAVDRLECAAARHAAIGAPLLEAESRIELGAALARRGFLADAHASWTAAATIAADLGANGLVRAARNAPVASRRGGPR
jgi:hypothetical protein